MEPPGVLSGPGAYLIPLVIPRRFLPKLISLPLVYLFRGYTATARFITKGKKEKGKMNYKKTSNLSRLIT